MRKITSITTADITDKEYARPVNKNFIVTKMDYYDKKTLAVAESVRKLSRVLSKIDNGGGDLSPKISVNPVTVTSQNAWVRYFDPNSKKFYYYNLTTKLTQWETPTSFVSAVQTSVQDQDVFIIREVLDEIVKVVSGEKDYVGNSSITNLSGIQPTTNWKQFFDHSSKRYYYHNIITNTTQWERPLDIGVVNPVPVLAVAAVALSATRIGRGSEDYRCMASFNKQNGKFCFGSLGPEATGLNYWEKVNSVHYHIRSGTM